MSKIALKTSANSAAHTKTNKQNPVQLKIQTLLTKLIIPELSWTLQTAKQNTFPSKSKVMLLFYIYPNNHSSWNLSNSQWQSECLDTFQDVLSVMSARQLPPSSPLFHQLHGWTDDELMDRDSWQLPFVHIQTREILTVFNQTLVSRSVFCPLFCFEAVNVCGEGSAFCNHGGWGCFSPKYSSVVDLWACRGVAPPWMIALNTASPACGYNKTALCRGVQVCTCVRKHRRAKPTCPIFSFICSFSAFLLLFVVRFQPVLFGFVLRLFYVCNFPSCVPIVPHFFLWGCFKEEELSILLWVTENILSHNPDSDLCCSTSGDDWIDGIFLGGKINVQWGEKNEFKTKTNSKKFIKN